MAAEEIELLEAMFPDELKVIEANKQLEMKLRPRTDLNESQGIFVFITLAFKLPEDYPSVSPIMEVKNARGIDEEGTVRLIKQLSKKAEELRGSPVLFELVQLARDLLTENNRPHEDCPICLIAFEENEDFVKTPCFHYFHIDCFLSYCETSIGDLKCPLCREILSGDFLSTVVGKGESASSSSAAVTVKPVEEPLPPQEVVPEVPPSRYILVTNLGNQTKLDWQGLFDNVFKLYGALAMTMVTPATVILEFKDMSVAEIALVNTDNSSIGGQKISCRFATDQEFQSSKENEEVHKQLQQLNLQNVQEQKEAQRQEQLAQQAQQAPLHNSHASQDIRHNRENTKFRNGPRHPKPSKPPRQSSHAAHHPPHSSHITHHTPAHSSSSSTPSSSSSHPSSSSLPGASGRPPQEARARKTRPNNSNNNSSNVAKKDTGNDVPVKS